MKACIEDIEDAVVLSKVNESERIFKAFETAVHTNATKSHCLMLHLSCYRTLTEVYNAHSEWIVSWLYGAKWS